MTLLFVLIAAAPLAVSPIPNQTCSSASAPALDHVVLVVRDLERASAPFLRHGFRLKNGRLHPNNLLNRHIKFRDGSSIELMTIQGAPGNAMARRYEDLLAVEEGGVYVAFNVPNIDTPKRFAETLRLETHESSSGPWRFLGFPATSSVAGVFFSAGGLPANDPDSLVTHRPDVDGLEEAWLEGGPELRDLLVDLGAKRCGRAHTLEGLAGERLGLSRGSVVVVPPRAGVRPRVLGVVLRTRATHAISRQPHPRFWIRYWNVRK